MNANYAMNVVCLSCLSGWVARGFRGKAPCLLSHVKPGANANHCEEGHDEGSEDLTDPGIRMGGSDGEIRLNCGEQ